MSMLASMVYRSSIDIKGVELFLYTFLSVMKKGKYKKKIPHNLLETIGFNRLGQHASEASSEASTPIYNGFSNYPY